MKSLFLLLIFSFSSFFLKAQEYGLDSILSKHKQVFTYHQNIFTGENLDLLISEINKHHYILIGEQHHTNEIPLFVNYLQQKINFDNYIMEGNQSVTNLLEKKLKNSQIEYHELLKKYIDRLGFYTFSEDRILLENFLLAEKNIIELDQVFASSDVLLLHELIKVTKNKEARVVYTELIKLSETRWSTYKKNPNVQPPFNYEELPLLFSRELSKQLQPVLSLNITEYERKIIQDLIYSNEIYAIMIEGEGLRSHDMRVSFMKKNLLDNHSKLIGKKNLFKFGANHVTKYKSLGQNTPDVGSLAFNLADAEGHKSLHIAMIEKSGQIGGPFDNNYETTGPSYLKPFFDLTKNKEQWLLFNLNKVKNEIIKKKININSIALTNFMDGFDFLIIIPEVTPQTKL